MSVYHIRKINFYSLPASIIAKAVAAFLPAIQQVLLRFTVKYHTVTGYMVLADFICTSKTPWLLCKPHRLTQSL